MSQSTAKTKLLQVRIRWMIRRDFAEVLDIEKDGFEFPWSDEEFLRHLREKNCIGMVAEHDERVVGFMVYELHRTRLDLLSLAVKRETRWLGIGRAMVTKLQGKLSATRRTHLIADVRESNLNAQLFFKACGFDAVATYRNYYEDTDEDAYRFVYRCQKVSV